MFLKEILSTTFDAFIKAAKGYDENNLRYKIEHLEMMFPKILDLSIFEQAEYADYITVKNVNEDWYIKMAKEIDLFVDELNSANTTSIGNLAYAALNCKDEDARRNCLLQLGKIKEHFKKL